METNATITIFNAFTDAETRRELYRASILGGASYLEGKGSGQTSGGTWESDLQYKIRIPYSNQAAAYYTPVEKYTGDGWTIQQGDIILLGGHNVGDMTRDELDRYARGIGQTPITVTEYADNTTRGSLTKHWRIGGK